MFYLGIDIGGTNLAAGIVNENHEIVARFGAKTVAPCAAEKFADDITAVINGALNAAGITLDDVPWVGIGCPGTINPVTGVVEYSNNLYFENLPLRELLQERLNGKKVLMENDANAAAYGEYIAGALKGADNAVAITLGTGLGGGIIINHQLYSGSNFAGAELGHAVIVVDGKPCTCGRKGCWESYSSATGLINMTKEHMQNAPKNSEIWKLVDGNIDNVSGRTAFDAMRAGDPTGQAIVDEYVYYLSVGTANMINIFQPDIICIGGGICNEGETLLAPLRKLAISQQYVLDEAKQTKICKAVLGNDAGVIGAAMLGIKA